MNARAPATRPLPASVAKGPTPSLIHNTQNAQKTTSIIASKAPQSDPAPRVTVCVRKRPLNPKEEAAAETDIVSVVSGCTVHVYEPKIKVDLTKHVVQHEFMFDSAFNEDSSNNDVFQRTAKPLVEFVVSGGKVNIQTLPSQLHTRFFPLTTSFIFTRFFLLTPYKASCFAFGQTGSGKTHTMMGRKEEKGLYLLAAQHLFSTLRSQGLELQVHAMRSL
jgi:hypothetical protein